MPIDRTRQAPEMAHTTTRQMPEMANAATQRMPVIGARQEMPLRGTETKPSWRSTELWIYLASVGGVLLASYLVDTNSSGADVFRADRAWWFITLLTIAYLGSRGLAKAATSWRRHGEH
jgi:hypothetical protein